MTSALKEGEGGSGKAYKESCVNFLYINHLPSEEKGIKNLKQLRMSLVDGP